MEQNSGIKPIVIEEIIELAKKYGIKRLVLFGSRARGDYKRTSDIDLAVEGGNHVRFALDVEDEVETLLKFDVINLDEEIPEELRESIEKEGVLLYEKAR